MPTSEMSASARDWGALWGDRPSAWAVTEEQQTPVYEAALSHVVLELGDRVLDVGCGTGVFLRMCADRGADVAGIDAAEGLLTIARARVPHADLRHGDMQALPFPEDAFELVTGFTSFFFAEDIVAALREAGRVARPGAPIVIQVFGPPERCDRTSTRTTTRSRTRCSPPAAPAPSRGPSGSRSCAPRSSMRCSTAVSPTAATACRTNGTS